MLTFQICGNGWAGKREVAKAIVSKFPELKVYLTQDRAWKERFHQNMFDAVALGVDGCKAYLICNECNLNLIRKYRTIFARNDEFFCCVFLFLTNFACGL